MKQPFQTGSFQANLLVVPLVGTDEAAESIACLSTREALQTQQMRIRETGEVSRLIIEVIGDVPVLIPEHEVLVGGGQNRTLTTSLLLDRGEHEVPVRCVERGRWNPSQERSFRVAEFGLPADVRQAKFQAGYAAYRQQGHFSPDQGRLWSAIEGSLRAKRIEDRTENVGALYERQRQMVDRLLSSFPALPNQVGMAVFVQGRLLGIEWMASPTLWKAHHEPLLRSYILGLKSTSATLLHPTDLEKLLSRLWERAWTAERIPAPAGKASHHIFVQESLQGLLLEQDGHPFLFSVLPCEASKNL
jgi:hypothetical protein